jgi:hypothetical protein
MLHTFVALVDDKPGVFARVASLFRRLNVIVFPTVLLLGCNSTPAPKTDTTPAPAPTPVLAPTRPTATPAPFKLFHYYNSSFTLTTPDNATDDEIAALIWQLRDAARTRTFDKLKLSQKDVDAGTTTWFHIYRGTKCASEKYTEGKLPCGASYHASGDYTYSSKSVWDNGILLHDEKETRLWNPDAPYTPPAH